MLMSILKSLFQLWQSFVGLKNFAQLHLHFMPELCGTEPKCSFIIPQWNCLAAKLHMNYQCVKSSRSKWPHTPLTGPNCQVLFIVASIHLSYFHFNGVRPAVAALFRGRTAAWFELIDLLNPCGGGRFTFMFYPSQVGRRFYKSWDDWCFR